jgi:DNA mismatch repair ATPase MutL
VENAIDTGAHKIREDLRRGAGAGKDITVRDDGGGMPSRDSALGDITTSSSGSSKDLPARHHGVSRRGATVDPASVSLGFDAHHPDHEADAAYRIVVDHHGRVGEGHPPARYGTELVVRGIAVNQPARLRSS